MGILLALSPVAAQQRLRVTTFLFRVQATPVVQVNDNRGIEVASDLGMPGMRTRLEHIILGLRL